MIFREDNRIELSSKGRECGAFEVYNNLSNLIIGNGLPTFKIVGFQLESAGNKSSLLNLRRKGTMMHPTMYIPLYEKLLLNYHTSKEVTKEFVCRPEVDLVGLENSVRSGLKYTIDDIIIAPADGLDKENYYSIIGKKGSEFVSSVSFIEPAVFVKFYVMEGIGSLSVNDSNKLLSWHMKKREILATKGREYHEYVGTTERKFDIDLSQPITPLHVNFGISDKIKIRVPESDTQQFLEFSISDEIDLDYVNKTWERALAWASFQPTHEQTTTLNNQILFNSWSAKKKQGVDTYVERQKNIIKACNRQIRRGDYKLPVRYRYISG